MNNDRINQFVKAYPYNTIIDQIALIEVIAQWENFRSNLEQDDKHFQNQGTNMNNCINPGESYPTDSETTKLAMMEEKNTYLICRIESIRRLLVDLSVDVSRVSTESGIYTRKMVSILEDVSMTFMIGARKEIRKQSNRVQAEVDAKNEDNNKNKMETSPGLEPADSKTKLILVCSLCNEPWNMGHECIPL